MGRYIWRSSNSNGDIGSFNSSC